MVESSTRQWLLNSENRRPVAELLILTNCLQSFQPCTVSVNILAIYFHYFLSYQE
jgi:hypothetical protein